MMLCKNYSSLRRADIVVDMLSMTRISIALISVALISATLAFNSAHASPRQAMTHDDEWNFTVFLDDTEIGYHRFAMSADNELTTITSNANFQVKFLFFTAYSYEHSNMEVWNNGCLARINAVTNDNGSEYIVNGSSSKGSFIVNQAEYANIDCAKTFAYWDPSFLQADALLNSQTGEIISVTSEYLGEDRIVTGEGSVDARKYRLSGEPEQGEPIRIDLWYSRDDRWLALQSYTEGGRIIRYTIEQAAKQ
jgi:hypothetical protein